MRIFLVPLLRITTLSLVTDGALGILYQSGQFACHASQGVPDRRKVTLVTRHLQERRIYRVFLFLEFIIFWLTMAEHVSWW
jgi:hypothetical protein